MTKVYDTGWETDHDSLSDYTIARQNGRTLAFQSTASNAWWAVYLEDDGFYTSLYLIRGQGSGWARYQLVTEDSSGGIVKNSATKKITGCACAFDTVASEFHVVWVEGNNGDSDSEIYHARCENPSAPHDSASWTTYGANKYQRVDNHGSSKHAMEPAIFVDEWNFEPIVVWQEENSGGYWEIFINVGDGANAAITPGNATCITTDGAAEGADWYLYPSLINCNEIGQEIFVAWFRKGISAYTVECKRLRDGDAWGTYGNWDGPESGTNTQDTVLTTGDVGATTGVTTMSYWYDQGAEVFVAASLEGIVKTNWFDEGALFFGAGDEWVDNVGAPCGSGTAVSVSQVDNNDFRTFRITAGNTCDFTDTDSANDLWWPTGGFQPLTADPTQQALWNAEQIGGISALGEVSIIFVDELPVSNKTIWFATTKKNTQPVAAIVTPKLGIGEDEEEAIYLTHTFSDSDGDTQDNWWAEVYEYGDWGSLAWGASGVRVDTGLSNPIPPNTLSTGSHYMWRVKVWDDNYGTEYGYNAESEWAPSTGTADFWTTLAPVLDITEYIQYPETRWPRITYDLLHNAEKGLAMGTAQYRVDGGSWTDMTEKSGVGSEGLTGLSTGTPVPDSHRFWWDSEVDEADIYSTDIDIRMEGHVTGKDYNQSTGMEEELDGILDTKDPTIGLTSPPDDDSLNVTQPPFIWQQAVDDSALWSSGAHLFQLDTVPTFDSPELQEYGWTDDLTWTPSTPLNRDEHYYWRVQAADRYLNLGVSPTFEFDVEELDITDYLKIVSNEKMYKLHNFTLKTSENAASVLSGSLGEEEIVE